MMMGKKKVPTVQVLAQVLKGNWAMEWFLMNEREGEREGSLKEKKTKKRRERSGKKDDDDPAQVRLERF